jgi:hypothetical protein
LPRVAKLLIALAAAAKGAPLYTTSAKDFVGLEVIVEVIVV